MYRNTGKDFDFAVEIGGIDIFLMQDVKLPTLGFGTVTHGTPGPVPNINTPGKPTTGDMTIQKLTPAFETEFTAWEWYAQVLSGNPALFAKSGFVKELRPAFGGTRRKWLIRDAWVKEIDVSNYTAQGENNIIETLTLEVWQCIPDPIAAFRQYWD